MVAKLTGSYNAEQAKPSKQADFAQCSDAREHEANDGGYNHKYGSACAVRGYSVQAN